MQKYKKIFCYNVIISYSQPEKVTVGSLIVTYLATVVFDSAKFKNNIAVVFCKC